MQSRYILHVLHFFIPHADSRLIPLNAGSDISSTNEWGIKLSDLKDELGDKNGTLGAPLVDAKGVLVRIFNGKDFLSTSAVFEKAKWRPALHAISVRDELFSARYLQS